ncbi:uncharacterized protein LOC103571110 isoform X1 [Microplitis demolitor]|uniref:uncharacterized protein LOC103571110 isoform X1 n=2 Tax=Microplitis demolitor TaxID=69319 RepID=UPI0004CCD838|nr:uncharacterized protein LOC103571110 isoform X1 [Microplitis demolitor]
MSNLCCVSLTIAARIIAALGLSISILMINVVMSAFFVKNEPDDFYSTIKTWTILGLHWTQYIKNFKLCNEVQAVFFSFLSYAFLLLISCTLLAFATIVRKPNCALPWMYLQIISIADQITALVIHLTAYSNSNNTQTSPLYWHSSLSSVFLLLSTYFWMIVFSARESWLGNHIRTTVNFDNLNPTIEDNLPRDSNLPKTPSYLAQSATFFQPTSPDNLNSKANIV